MLRYRAGEQKYVGEWYTVAPPAFDEALGRLLRRGYLLDDACALLLFEHEWDAALPGVEVKDAQAAVDAAESLLRGGGRSASR